jgi:hypothetical protein
MNKKEIIELIKENGALPYPSDKNLKFKKVETYTLWGYRTEKYILFNDDVIYTIDIRDDGYICQEMEKTNDVISDLQYIIQILKEKADKSCTLNDNYFLNSPAYKKLDKLRDGLANQITI